MDVLGRDPETAWIADDMAVELAGLAHRRGVDNRQEPPRFSLRTR